MCRSVPSFGSGWNRQKSIGKWRNGTDDSIRTGPGVVGVGKGGQSMTDDAVSTDNPESMPLNADTTDEDSPSTLATIAVACCRLVQGVLVAAAAVFILGALQMNAIAFAAIGVFALVLLGFAGVVEGVVRLIRGHS
jgi:hypothetical protein